MKKEFTQHLIHPVGGKTIRILAHYIWEGEWIVSDLETVSKVDMEDLSKEDAELIYKAAEKIGTMLRKPDEDDGLRQTERDEYRHAIKGFYTFILVGLMFAANAGERVKDVQKTNVDASARFREVVGNDITKINPHVSYTVSGTEVTVL